MCVCAAELRQRQVLDRWFPAQRQQLGWMEQVRYTPLHSSIHPHPYTHIPMHPHPCTYTHELIYPYIHKPTHAHPCPHIPPIHLCILIPYTHTYRLIRPYTYTHIHTLSHHARTHSHACTHTPIYTSSYTHTLIHHPCIPVGS